jgi:hypothetical protein
VLKELMRTRKLKWGGLPDEIFKETILQEIKNLCHPAKLAQEIKELESLPDYARAVSSKF